MMSKILIVSDSHGQRSELEELKNRHGQEVKLMIHCGDSELSEQDIELQGYSVVKGNCDFYGDFSNEIIEEVNGFRFFVTHGHLHSVKSSLLNLLYRAEEENAQIVCFGHSHVLGAEMIHNKLFINPGSLRLPRGRKERTYVILEIEESKVDLKVFDFDHGEMVELRKTFEFKE